MTEEKRLPVLQANHLQKSFSFENEKIQVLKSVDLELDSSQSLSIRGDSGCGKSTLLNLLARLELGDSGEIWWGEQKMNSAQKPSTALISERAHFLGVIYQSYYLIPELTVLQNVIFAGRLIGEFGNASVERARDLLGKMGMVAKERQIPSKLSGGERQRVAIARALINRPKVILADEPTGNLDERTAGEVMELLLQACQEAKASLILVTHNRKYAEATDRTTILSDGELQEL